MAKTALTNSQYYVIDGKLVQITKNKRDAVVAQLNGLEDPKDIAEAIGVNKRNVYDYKKDGGLQEWTRWQFAEGGVTIQDPIKAVADAMQAVLDNDKPDHRTRIRAAKIAFETMGYSGPNARRLDSEEEAAGDNGVITVEEIRRIKGRPEDIMKRMAERKNAILNGEVEPRAIEGMYREIEEDEPEGTDSSDTGGDAFARAGKKKRKRADIQGGEAASGEGGGVPTEEVRRRRRRRDSSGLPPRTKRRNPRLVRGDNPGGEP